MVFLASELRGMLIQGDATIVAFEFEKYVHLIGLHGRCQTWRRKWHKSIAKKTRLSRSTRSIPTLRTQSTCSRRVISTSRSSQLSARDTTQRNRLSVTTPPATA